jgi:hypothetical protein
MFTVPRAGRSEQVSDMAFLSNPRIDPLAAATALLGIVLVAVLATVL